MAYIIETTLPGGGSGGTFTQFSTHVQDNFICILKEYWTELSYNIVIWLNKWYKYDVHNKNHFKHCQLLIICNFSDMRNQ